MSRREQENIPDFHGMLEYKKTRGARRDGVSLSGPVAVRRR